MTETNTAGTILSDVKKVLGIADSNTSYDLDITMFINTTLASLFQMGSLIKKVTVPGNDITYLQRPFVIDGTTTWTTISTDMWPTLEGSDLTISLLKSYLYIKTRLIFDPPENSTLNQALRAQADELEWRLYITSNYRSEEVSFNGV